MRRRDLLRSALAVPFASPLTALAIPPAGASGRTVWTNHLDRIARPVLEALAERRLRASMPIEAHTGMEQSRKHTTHLEAFGRLLSGMAPWLELYSPPESELQRHYLDLVPQALASALDPKSPDALEFAADNQNLVDAAFLALAILRAPRVLNTSLNPALRSRLADALRATRVLRPGFNNWLLFAACVEAALAALGQPWDEMRVDYAIREHISWYVGDGAYGDGPHFHWDFYNSFVIHPFLLAVLDQVGEHRADWKNFAPIAHTRAARYAAVQERMIAPDGSYPVLGRSITYRCGAFHLLADIALRGALPTAVSPEQTRCALAAVMDRTLSPAGTFDSHGWLRIGLAGHQPALGEPYISTGSLYLCATAFLPLGLPASDRFWSAPGALWTAKQAWAGVDVAADHAIEN
jgi:hypothetical protein